LCLLPGDHAGSRPDRDAEEAAEFDYRSGTRKESRQDGRGRRRGAGLSGQMAEQRSREGFSPMKNILKGFAALALAAGMMAGPVLAQDGEEGAVAHYPLRKPVERDWSFAGPFGTFDRG